VETESRVAWPASGFSAANEDVEPSEAGSACELRVMHLRPPDGFGQRGRLAIGRVPLASGAGVGRGVVRRETDAASARTDGRLREIDCAPVGGTCDESATTLFDPQDLCADPETVMRKLCAFLELDFTASTMSRASSPVHHLGGSPSKFDPARRVPAADLSFLNHLTQADLRSLHQVAGDHALRWGYV